MSPLPPYNIRLLDGKRPHVGFITTFFYLVPKLLIRYTMSLKLLISIYKIQLIAFVKIIEEKSYHVRIAQSINKVDISSNSLKPKPYHNIQTHNRSPTNNSFCNNYWSMNIENPNIMAN